VLGPVAAARVISVTSYEALFQSLQIGPVLIRNRIMSTAHTSGASEDGKPQARYQAYQEEKARGGIGLTIIGGSTSVAAWAQGLSGQWTSEGARAEIDIYSCGATGHDVSNQQLLETLCGYVTDKGPRLCGRVVKVLPKGLAELQAKGKKAEDVFGHPVLCVASAPDQTWPWKGGVFNLDDSTPYWIRLSPQGADKLKGSACGLGGWYCPTKGEFVWIKAEK
jgi:hypothetical protein